MVNQEQEPNRRPRPRITKRELLVVAGVAAVAAGTVTWGVEVLQNHITENHDHPVSTGIKDGYKNITFAYTLPPAKEPNTYIGKVGLEKLLKVTPIGDKGESIRSNDPSLFNAFGIQPEKQDQLLLGVFPYEVIFPT